MITQCLPRIQNVSLSVWSIVFTAIVTLVCLANIRWAKPEYQQHTIISDGKGYYAYLPAIFIYHDLNYGFFEKIDLDEYYNPNHYYEYWLPYENTRINKYYCGTAVMQLPFFLSAHAITHITHEKADGYSKWYQISVGLAAFFWVLFGLYYLDKLLRLYNISATHRSIVILASFFGTNAFYYTIVEPAMSHVYSMALVSFFAYFSKKYFITNNVSILPWIALSLGFIVITRPVNVLVVLIWPFLAGNLYEFLKGITKIYSSPKWLFGALLLFFAVISIQCGLYKISVGKWWVYSYRDEGFYFLDPHFFDMLFSYRKGLFLYTPMYLLSLGGLYFVWKNSKYSAISWLIFFVVTNYVLSSWWIWYYGGSFSSRVYIEFIPIFMILLGVLLRDIGMGWKRNMLVFSMFLLVILCQIQTYQYRYYQIHWSDMDKNRYWDVFLRIDKL